MPGLIERNARIRMTLKQRGGISDGKPVWTSVLCNGFTLDMTQADVEYFGRIKDGRIFLIAPLIAMRKTPTLPKRCGLWN